MKYLILGMVILMSGGCATTPVGNQTVWIDGFVDTGALVETGLSDDNIQFLGSVNASYSNINQDQVDSLDEMLLQMLQHKYGKGILFQKTAVLDRQYLIQYEITNNKVTHDQERLDTKTCYRSSRDMGVSFSVLDSSTREVVWGGLIDKQLFDRSCNSDSKSNSDNDEGGFLGAILGIFVSVAVDIAFDAVTGTYPSPPSINNLASKIFDGFYRSLPDKVSTNLIESEQMSGLSK